MPTKLTSPKVSNRMKQFVDNALPALPFWDVCCDHGYIGIAALKSLKFEEVHFVDQVPHIMERLDKLIHQSPHLNPAYNFFLHISSGENLDMDIYGTILIAGVGGTTIIKILDSLFERQYLKANRLLLSPHLDEHILIPYLESNPISKLYTLTEKILMSERRRIRPLYIYDKI